ncbi:glycine/betaine ABC transporter substrate-binding protein [Streptococcus equinus]|uniref:glycine betaine ABC transporter substrate-binding protein n=1 Tax=Streptococcus equinus TaxID=1335 RepID=UPI00106F199E|nr:glycine betaine ABC transporter substrate-binding protein [Streptococcus equinus]TFH45224.1 glycine/betaine ABC transporter substrate-binding protein [Streptococcus equinus]
MKNKKVLAALIGIIVLVLVAGIALWKNNQADKSTSKASTTIRVGSKDFTESLVVSEIYALALEDNGYKVDRVSNISSSLIHKSLVNDEIDLYPEYTGTALLTILGDDMETDPDKVYQTVKKEYEEKYNLTWLNYSEANDSSGLAMRKETADKYNIKTISDLQKNASNIRMASQGEYEEREDGLPALEKVYGEFNWKSSKVYDNSLKYQILENDEADVTPAYTTEGRLAETDKFVLLEDDKHVWPPYNLAPVVRDNVLEANPSIKKILNKVSAKLDTETVTKLNAKVDVDGEEYTDVAKEFYDSIK